MALSAYQPQGLDLAEQRAGIHAEFARGGGAIAGVPAQRILVVAGFPGNFPTDGRGERAGVLLGLSLPGVKSAGEFPGQEQAGPVATRRRCRAGNESAPPAFAGQMPPPAGVRCPIR